MIKAEVVFNEDNVICNGYVLYVSCESLRLCVDGIHDEFDTIEQAIKWCLEN